MVKAIILSLLSISFLSFHVSGQEISSVSAIPDSLKRNANAVYFLDEGKFEIVANNKAIFKVRQIIAILNPNATWLATKTLGYDKLTKINSFKATQYDAFGNIMKKLKKSEIIDQSSNDGFSVFTDNRIKYADLRQLNYPFIVEFEFEIEYKYTYSIPDWNVLPQENVSVIKSNYSILSPIAYKPRVKIKNTDKVFIEKEAGGLVYMDIEFNNMVAKEREWYGPDFEELTPIIRCGSSKFNYDGYEGDMSTWEAFGKWQLALNKGRNDLSVETINQVKILTENIDSREAKIKAVYEFVQNKTRYVSIQLGIGGFQPFPASEVDELGYGDCKALSNYTYSLLKGIGISSNYTMVYGGKDPPEVDRNFPDDTFNHIILCVPNEKDTVWLECTSQTNPFGYLGEFTGDRDVLVVNESGGEVVHTTTYIKEDNKQISNINVVIEEEGKSMANVQIKYSGLQSDNFGLNFILNDTEKEQKKWIYKNTNISDFTVEDFSFEIDKKRIPVVTEKLNLAINNFSNTKGTRLFFAPNINNKLASNPKKYSNRQTDVIIKTATMDIDTVIYTVPEKFSTEFLSEPILFESEFGKYQAKVIYDTGKLMYVRKIEWNKGRYPKESYNAFRKFHKDISKADNMKVVFIDKT